MLKRTVQCLALVIATMTTASYLYAVDKNKMDVGRNHYCLIDTNSHVQCEGDNSYGQAENHLDNPYGRVATASYSTCALNSNTYKVECWGLVATTPPDIRFQDIFTNQGTGNQNDVYCGVDFFDTTTCWTADEDSKVIPPEDLALKQFSMGLTHGCGISSDFSIVCWGNTQYKGDPPAGEYVQVDTGWNVSCALKSDNTLACWGDDSIADVPTGSFFAVSVGSSHACAISSDDYSVTCWGEGDRHIDGEFIEVDANNLATCARSFTNEVTCWSDNSASGNTFPYVWP